MNTESNQMRSPEDFAEARRVVTERIIKTAVPDDIELFMQFTTILDALRIAEIISRRQR